MFHGQKIVRVIILSSSKELGGRGPGNRAQGNILCRLRGKLLTQALSALSNASMAYGKEFMRRRRHFQLKSCWRKLLEKVSTRRH